MAVAPGTLFIVATPIGNLDDLTVRAKKTLELVEAILAEDTRRTRNLLAHLGVSKPLRTFNAHADERAIERVAEEIASGKDLAIVSDAGTPLVSDPGAELVRAVVAHGGNVVAIPGASAVLVALASSGLATNAFRFVGFLPRSGGERAEALAKVTETDEAVILFEAGNRVVSTIEELAVRMPARACAVGRELTKLHEETIRGTLGELATSLASRELIGEVTIVLGAWRADRGAIDESAIDARIDAELVAGRGSKEASDIVAAWSGRSRRDIYARVLGRKPRR